MKLSAQLTEEQAKKLSFIQEKTKQNTDEILGEAIEYYYKNVVQSANENLLENFQKVGFVGCIEAEPNLAEDSELILMQELHNGKE